MRYNSTRVSEWKVSKQSRLGQTRREDWLRVSQYKQAFGYESLKEGLARRKENHIEAHAFQSGKFQAVAFKSNA